MVEMIQRQNKIIFIFEDKETAKESMDALNTILTKIPINRMIKAGKKLSKRFG